MDLSRNEVPQASYKGVSPIVNVRFPPTDKDVICQAAALSSMPIATFIRAAAVSYARQVVSNGGSVVLLSSAENQSAGG